MQAFCLFLMDFNFCASLGSIAFEAFDTPWNIIVSFLFGCCYTIGVRPGLHAWLLEK